MGKVTGFATHSQIAKESALEAFEKFKQEANKSIEMSARDILARFPFTREYVQVYGSWFFEVDGEPVGIVAIRKLLSKGLLAKNHIANAIEAHSALIATFQELGLELTPMRFVKGGEKKTEW